MFWRKKKEKVEPLEEEMALKEPEVPEEETIVQDIDVPEIPQQVIPENVSEQQNTAQEEVIAQEETLPAQEEVVQQEPEKKGWFSRLKQGLSKSSSKLTDGLNHIFVRKKLDDEMLEELEELLITSDLGVQVATTITSSLAKDRYDKDISVEEVKQVLANSIADILNPVAVPLASEKPEANTPRVILVCGVNGTGKTTTTGKLAHYYQQQGKKVVVAACDTFRAAAVEQLAIWCERAGCPLIKGAEQSDPASVAYQAVSQAIEEQSDMVFIDTAGRLHNKKNLMEELVKIVRVIKKVAPDAPHDTLLVLDATTGQNAHNQVDVFQQMVSLSGLVVTKLDGTAKGGVVVSLAQKFALPIHAIGVGEGVDDLQSFDSQSFAESLVS